MHAFAFCSLPCPCARDTRYTRSTHVRVLAPTLSRPSGHLSLGPIPLIFLSTSVASKICPQPEFGKTPVCVNLPPPRTWLRFFPTIGLAEGRATEVSPARMSHIPELPSTLRPCNGHRQPLRHPGPAASSRLLSARGRPPMTVRPSGLHARRAPSTLRHGPAHRGPPAHTDRPHRPRKPVTSPQRLCRPVFRHSPSTELQTRSMAPVALPAVTHTCTDAVERAAIFSG